MAYQVIVTSKAEQDLENIRDFISQDNSDAAEAFCLELIQATKSLRTFPNRLGMFRKSPKLRKLTYRSYLIFYKINEKKKTVEILRFWHGAQDRNRLRLKEEAPVYAQVVQPQVATVA